jgi:hypothetical protein
MLATSLFTCQILLELLLIILKGFHVVPVMDSEGHPVVEWVQGKALSIAMRTVASKFPNTRLLIPIDVSCGIMF